MQPPKKYSQIALLVGLFALIWLPSCNIYKQLANHPPQTAKDSAAILALCTRLTPIDTSTKNQPPIKFNEHPDSSQYYRDRFDSLGKIKQTMREIIIKRYKDTCSSVIKVADDQYNQGFDDGVTWGKQGSADYYKKQLDKADSVCKVQHDSIVTSLKNAYNLQLITATNSEGIALKDADKYRGKMDFWKTWALVTTSLMFLFIIIAIILWKFRRYAKKANNIINDVEDLTKKT